MFRLRPEQVHAPAHGYTLCPLAAGLLCAVFYFMIFTSFPIWQRNEKPQNAARLASEIFLRRVEATNELKTTGHGHHFSGAVEP